MLKNIAKKVINYFDSVTKKSYEKGDMGQANKKPTTLSKSVSTYMSKDRFCKQRDQVRNKDLAIDYIRRKTEQISTTATVKQTTEPHCLDGRRNYRIISRL